jgi:hypothetical protein
MVLRAAHGMAAPGKPHELYMGPVVAETLKANRLPKLNADDTVEGLALAKKRGRPFQRGNRAASGRRPALASASGIPLVSKDPEYQKHLRWARAWRKKRVSELSIMHGGYLSSGVCAMITSAAIDMAASRYLSVKAAATGETEFMLLASKLAQSSKQQELCALEIASRENAARKESMETQPVDPMAGIRAQLVESK